LPTSCRLAKRPTHICNLGDSPQTLVQSCNSQLGEIPDVFTSAQNACSSIPCATSSTDERLIDGPSLPWRSSVLAAAPDGKTCHADPKESGDRRRKQVLSKSSAGEAHPQDQSPPESSLLGHIARPQDPVRDHVIRLHVTHGNFDLGVPDPTGK
jgi:hypothetical protein